MSEPVEFSPPPESLKSHSRPLDPWLIPLLMCFILTTLLSSTLIRNYDLGTDLRTGQWILQHLAFPQKDEFTYTCNQNDYLDGKPLYQVATYAIYSAFGYSGISVLKTAFILVIFMLMWFRIRLTQCPSWLTVLLLFWAVIVTERRFNIRAEIWSWLLMSAILLILEKRNGGLASPLWLLPVLQWLWVNVEGLFILGWFLMATYLLSSRFRRGTFDKRLLKYVAISLAVSLLNPYGFKIFTLPLTYFFQFHNSANSDLVSPLQFLATQNLKVDWNIHIFLYFGFCFLLLMAFLLTFKSRKFHEWVLALTFLGLSILGYRNIPLFLIVGIPLLAESWGQLRPLALLVTPKSLPAGKQTRFVPYLSAALLLLLCLRVGTGAYYISDRRIARLGFGLDIENVPVGAAEFLSRNHLDGRIMNYIGMGDWLIWKGPQPVFIDGRQQIISSDFYNQYLDSFNARGLIQLTALYQPQLIALNYNDAVPWAVQLKLMPEWRLIYVDETFAIYAKRDYAPSIPEFHFPDLVKERNIILSPDQVEHLAEDTQPSACIHWLKGFYRPQIFPNGLQSMGLFALHYGEFATAHTLFAESLRQAGGGYWDVFYNLGVSSLRLSQYRLGKICLEKSLQLNSGNPSTLQMLDSLKGY
ncbi:MAG TPA: hypothetical protein VMV05_01105 [bacterium]|nr:hypothetical protein [bacterium]